VASCREIEPQLSLLVDGLLTADEQQLVRLHVRTCASCRGMLADFERVRTAAREIGDIPPPEHVWLEVAGQIRLAQPAASVSTTADRPATQWIGLAAALVLVTAGLYVFQRANTPPPEAPADTRPASVEAVADELNLAAAHYEKAIAELEALSKGGDAAVDDAVVAVVQRNLGAIDSAIAESRAALVSNPDSEPARDSLFDALRRKLAVLQTTVSLINGMRLGDQESARQAADSLGKS